MHDFICCLAHSIIKMMKYIYCFLFELWDIDPFLKVIKSNIGLRLVVVAFVIIIDHLKDKNRQSFLIICPQRCKEGKKFFCFYGPSSWSHKVCSLLIENNVK